jgi:hypothetical protein
MFPLINFPNNLDSFELIEKKTIPNKYNNLFGFVPSWVLPYTNVISKK